MNFAIHNAPRRERLLLHVLEGEKAVAGLPLLIRELAVSHGEELFVQVGRLFGVVQLVVRSCRQEQGRRRLWQDFITNFDCLQGGRGVVIFRGGEGEMTGGEGEVVFAGEGRGLGDGALEKRLGFGEFFEMNLNVGAVVEEGGVLGGGDDEGVVERRGFIVLLVAAVEAGEETGEVRVFGMGGVELFNDGDGLGGFVLLIVEVGELRVESGVVGVFGEGGGEEGFGLVGFLLREEDVDEGGGGVGVFGVGGEEASVGGFGGDGIAGGFGEFAGEEDVVFGFGGELEGGEELVTGEGVVGATVEAGEGAEGVGFEERVVGGEGGGEGEFGVGFGEFAGAGEKEAEGEVGFEVGGFGGGLVEGVLGIGEVVEDVGVGGGFFGEGGEEFESGGVVLFVEGVAGLGEEGVLWGWLRLGCGVGGAGGELGVGGGCHEERCGKYQGWEGPEAATELAEVGGSVPWSALHLVYPLPCLKVCKVFEENDLSLDFRPVLSAEARPGMAGLQ